MKTNNRFLGEVALKPGSTSEYYQVGKLRDDRIDVFARYYVRYVQAYARLGIRVDALTLLNEPGMDVVYPAMDISVEQQQKLSVAINRELRRARLDVDLYIHDFNFWDWRDPNSTATKNYYRVLNDPAAARAADAIAFHPYWGDPTVMRDAYEQTGKPVHLTETSDLSPATVLADFRLDASSYILWAQATDQDGGTLHWTPARDNNVDWDEVARTTKWPDRLVKVDTTARTFTVRDELYQLGQFARYLTPYARAGRLQRHRGRHRQRRLPRPARRLRRGHRQRPRHRAHRTGRPRRQVVRRHGARARLRHVPLDGRPAPRPQPRPGPAGAVVDRRSTSTAPPRCGCGHRPDRDALAYYATDLPDGVTVDAATGVVTLHPTVRRQHRPDRHRHRRPGRAHRGTVHVTVQPHGAPVGEKIEAEAYVAQHGWTDGGAELRREQPRRQRRPNVGWTPAGNWLAYRLDVAAAGTYDVELRVANGTGAPATGAISLRDATGAILATASVPDTGGWGDYQSVHVPVTARRRRPAADAVLRDRRLQRRLSAPHRVARLRHAPPDPGSGGAPPVLDPGCRVLHLGTGAGYEPDTRR